jgi:hypothetical protein
MSLNTQWYFYLIAYHQIILLYQKVLNKCYNNATGCSRTTRGTRTKGWGLFGLFEMSLLTIRSRLICQDCNNLKLSSVILVRICDQRKYCCLKHLEMLLIITVPKSKAGGMFDNYFDLVRLCKNRSF